MQFNDTSTNAGIIQECEFWTNLGNGTISGNTTLLKQFTARANRAFDNILPIMLSAGDTMRFDDPNHTKFPIATFDITSGYSDYSFASDQQGNSVLNIIDVHILQSTTATQYQPLDRFLLNTEEARTILAQNSLNTGVPSAFVEKGGTIFFDLIPNYTVTGGGKVFFERSPSYFVYTDTTKTAGIPELFQPLLPLYMSYDWLLVFKPEAATLISRLEAHITQMRTDLQNWVDKQNPTEVRLELEAPSHL
jgi:hypothetical protein